MLEKIQYGTLHIIVTDEKRGSAETFTVGNKHKSETEPEVTLTVKNPATWLRLCANLDAVSKLT